MFMTLSAGRFFKTALLLIVMGLGAVSHSGAALAQTTACTNPKAVEAYDDLQALIDGTNDTALISLYEGEQASLENCCASAANPGDQKTCACAVPGTVSAVVIPGC